MRTRGQGSPVSCSSQSQLNGWRASLRKATVLTARVFYLILVVCSLLSSPLLLHGVASAQLLSEPTVNQPSPPVRFRQSRDINLRISWGGGSTPVRWAGTVSSTTGLISQFRSLGLTQDNPGSTYLDNGQLVFDQPSATIYNAVEVTVRYEPEGELLLRLVDQDRPDLEFQTSVPFSKLLKDAYSEEMGDESRINIARSPGDRLQLQLARDHLIFESGEVFELGVLPTLCGIENGTGRCKVSVNPARGGSSLWNDSIEFELDESGNSEGQLVSVPIPEIEGVYDVEIQLEPKSLTQRLSNATVTRSIQLVALSKVAPRSSGELWREHFAADPTSQRVGLNFSWLQVLRSTEFKAPYHANRKIEKVDERKFVALGQDGWQAIGLKTTSSGKPMILDVEYLAEEGVQIGFSLFDGHDSRNSIDYGFDTGVTVPGSFGVSESPQLRTHQVVFWPQSGHSILVVSNRADSGKVARIGGVRVMTGPSRLAADTHVPDDGLKDRLRQFMAFFETPLFPENFGANEIEDEAISQHLDDWETFYVGADRMVQYLKANGYSGAILNVAADSSTLYPSELLESTPVLDSGVFFASGQDPLQKDVLELLFRMFDREGLNLVPALAFSGPLPRLEERIRQEGAGNYRLVDFRGYTNEQKGPAYNALNPTVQQAVNEVVSELTRRYSSHPSFTGLSFVCRPDTYTQLHGRRWGYDSPTITRFLDESGGVQLASGVGNDLSQLQNMLLGSHETQWLRWRALEMANWYSTLQESISFDETNRRLYLAPVNIYQHPDIISSLSPSLHWANPFQEAMLELGWQMDYLKANPSVVLLKPRMISSDQALAKQRVELLADQSSETHEFFKSQAITGELFSHEAKWRGFLAENGQAFAQGSRLQQFASSGAANRSRFTASLRALDSRLLVDGSWLLNMGQEEALADLVDVFTRLPDIPFDEVTPESGAANAPLTVRQALSAGRWYFYAINDSPWPIKVRLNLNRGEEERIESLSLKNLNIEVDGDQRFIRIVMEPYSLIGGFSDNAANQISAYQHSVEVDAASRMESRLRQLQLRLIQASEVQPAPFLENTEMSVDETGSLNGWFLDPANNHLFSPQQNGGSETALVMSCEQGSNWLRSNPFATPETGRLSVSVWMKVDDAQQQPALRIAVESEDSGYYRFGSTGSLVPEDLPNQLATEWRQFVVHFDDIPSPEKHPQLRIGFDLMAPGSVIINRVETYDRLFDSKDIQALSQRLGSASPLVENELDYDRCRRMLNGYWLQFLHRYIGPGKSKTNEAVTKQSASEVPRTSRMVDRLKIPMPR